MNPVSKRWDKVARKYEEYFWSQPLLQADAAAVERLVQAARASSQVAVIQPGCKCPWCLSARELKDALVCFLEEKDD